MTGIKAKGWANRKENDPLSAKEPLLWPNLETRLKLIKGLCKNIFYIYKELGYQLGVYKSIQERVVLTNQI